MANSKRYPAKLLLLGEYSVLLGSKALAIPLRSHYLTWEKISFNEFNGALIQFAKYLEIYSERFKYLNIPQLIKDFDSGWTLRGNIPTGYGIGSSGAVCAAILDKYQYESADIEASHNQLIQMESYFHGKSSGLDPLVSFYDKPVLINGGKASLIDESYMNHLRNYKISLIDSGVKRKTEHFVNLFNEKLVNPEWKQKYIEEILPLNNALIDQYLKNETFDFVINWKKLSELSLHYYKEMIIPSIETNWNSLYNKNNYIKINGAGGGGFYIFLSENQSIELNGLKKMSISEF